MVKYTDCSQVSESPGKSGPPVAICRAGSMKAAVSNDCLHATHCSSSIARKAGFRSNVRSITNPTAHLCYDAAAAPKVYRQAVPWWHDVEKLAMELALAKNNATAFPRY